MNWITQAREAHQGPTYRQPPHMDAKALIVRAAAKLRAWHEKYGEHQPQWLPPAGDVKWLEDAAAYVAAHTLPAASGVAPSAAPSTEATIRRLMQVAHKWAGPDEADRRTDALEMELRRTFGVPACGNTPYDEGPFSIDHERSAFEAAMRVKHPEWAFTADPVFDYHNERTRCAWEGWQAARTRGVAVPATGEKP